MPNIDYSGLYAKALGFVPESSVGVVTPLRATSSGSKELGENGISKEWNDLFDTATPDNKVPIVILPDTPGVDAAVINEQFEKQTQIYITETITDDDGLVTQIILKREIDGKLENMGGFPPTVAVPGEIADSDITVDGKLPVQDDPETTPTETETETEKSYVFFDPIGKQEKSRVDKALGAQYDVARYVGKYKKNKQEHIEKHVNLVPVDTVDPDNYTYASTENAKLVKNYGSMDKSVAQFQAYWEKEVESIDTCKIILFNAHGWRKGIAFEVTSDGGNVSLNSFDCDEWSDGSSNVSQFADVMKPTDYVVLLSCNNGLISDSDNIAIQFSRCAKDKIKAVIAADGNTSPSLNTYPYSGKPEHMNIEAGGTGFRLFINGVVVPKEDFALTKKGTVENLLKKADKAYKKYMK